MFCIQKKTHSRYCLFQPSVRRALFSFSSSVSEKLVFFSFFSEFPNTGIGLDINSIGTSCKSPKQKLDY